MGLFEAMTSRSALHLAKTLTKAIITLNALPSAAEERQARAARDRD